ncbi:hypothetical protein [Nonomuraea typhae]|uniref:hypothetical protein n=1 Tax=Nonomuraea typhae TaxID=2603600 RepID=UPI001CA5532C|nr:hypothetical protein [Nonomuraea typhae]
MANRQVIHPGRARYLTHLLTRKALTMMPNDADTSAVDRSITVVLAEYERLKTEQTARIGFRDNLLYATLTAIAAIATVTASTARLELLLVLPLTGMVLGWTHLANDHMVSAIGRYIREDLTPRLANLIVGCPRAQLFGWEHDHRGDTRRRSRQVLQLSVNLDTFCTPSVAGLVVFWAFGNPSPLLIAVSLIELGVVAILAAQIIAYSGLLPARRQA